VYFLLLVGGGAQIASLALYLVSVIRVTVDFGCSSLVQSYWRYILLVMVWIERNVFLSVSVTVRRRARAKRSAVVVLHFALEYGVQIA